MKIYHVRYRLRGTPRTTFCLTVQARTREDAREYVRFHNPTAMKIIVNVAPPEEPDVVGKLASKQVLMELAKRQGGLW